MTEPNEDTVRSLADLLVQDTLDNETEAQSKSSSEKDNHSRPPSTANSTNNSTLQRDAGYDEMNDSVFGDIALEEPPSISFNIKPDVTNVEDPHFQYITSEEHEKKLELQRHASLRSQLSTTSTHKEPPKREIKVKLFVSTLFIIIVTVVAVVLHFAHLQEYMVELGKKIIVYEDKRWIHLVDIDRTDALVGQFGLGIPPGILPHDCSQEKLRKSHLCLKWKEKALLDINYWEDGLSKCYNIGWKSLHPDTVLKDCYKLDNDDVHWFGGFLKVNQQWPLMNVSIPLMPYITGELGDADAFGPVIERYWLSSKGVAIFSPDLSSPLQVSWNALDPSDSNATSGDDQLCLMVGGVDHKRKSPEPSHLNYTLCLSENILDVHRLALEKISTGRNISESMHRDVFSFPKPSLSVYWTLSGEVNQTSVMNLAERIKNNSLDIGRLYVESGWQMHSGDLQFDENKFHNVSSMLASLDEMHYDVLFGLSPYISVHSKNFIPSVNDDMLVKDGGGEAPGVFRINTVERRKDTNLHAALDITYPLPQQWLLDEIKRMKQTLGIKHFSFQGGTTTMLPYTSKFTDNSTDLNLYTHHYGSLALEDGQLTVMDSATNFQGEPVVIRLTISDLETALPLLLTLGFMGYPYAMPEMHLTPFGTLPSKELYIRSVQLAAFMPVMHLTYPPDVYDEDTVSIVRNVIKMHQELVNTRVRNHSRLFSPFDPVVKPLWWFDPNDAEAVKRDSEFIVGEDLLVAPILRENTYSRDVYLPEGKWRDHRDSKIYIGPHLLGDYVIKLDQVAYFIKM